MADDETTEPTNSVPPTAPAAIQPHLVDLKDAARLSGLSIWTLRTLVSSGYVPKVILPGGRRGADQRRIWIARTDLLRFLDGCRQRSDGPGNQPTDQRDSGNRRKRRPH